MWIYSVQMEASQQDSNKTPLPSNPAQTPPHSGSLSPLPADQLGRPSVSSNEFSGMPSSISDTPFEIQEQRWLNELRQRLAFLRITPSSTYASVGEDLLTRLGVTLPIEEDRKKQKRQDSQPPPDGEEPEQKKPRMDSPPPPDAGAAATQV